MTFSAPPEQEGFVYQEFPNSYIFCLKDLKDKEPSLDDAKEFDKDYDSAYTIEPKFVRGFAEILKASLLTNLTLNHFEDNIKDRLTSLPLSQQSVKCLVFADHVQYGKSKIQFPEGNENQRQLEERVLESLFRKTEKDTEQQEFRLAFILINDSLGTLTVKKDPILVPTSPIFQISKHHNLG